MTFARDLSLALEMTFKAGTIRPWGDGKRVKLRSGEWIGYRPGQGAGGQVRGDEDAVKRAQKERENLKSAVQDLKRDWDAGNLDKSMSFGQHIELSKRLIGRHAASLDRTLSNLKSLTPDNAPETLGPCKTVKGKVEGCYKRISGRVKTLSSAVGKLSRKHHKQKPDGSFDMSRPHLNRADKLKDLTGARVLAEDNASVLKTVEKFKAKYGRRIVSFEDMISEARSDGYRSIHAEFTDDDGLVKEVQFRTPNQQKWADWSHDIYKPTNATQREALRQINSDPARKKEMDKYASDVSAYYARIDDGKEPGEKPECPETLSKSPFGCLE